MTFQGTHVNVDTYLLESDLTLVDGVGATDTDQIKNGVTGCTGGADVLHIVVAKLLVKFAAIINSPVINLPRSKG